MQSPFSDIALRAHVRRSDSLTGFLICAVVCVGLVWFVVRPPGRAEPLFISAVILLFAVFTGAGALTFGRRVFYPPLMLEATREGIITYQSLRAGGSDAGRVGRLVTWSDIESIGAETIRVPSSDGDVTVHCVVLRLHPGHSAPVQEVSLGNPDKFAVKLGRTSPHSNENALYLDGKTDFGPYTDLAAELERMRRTVRKCGRGAAFGQNRDD